MNDDQLKRILEDHEKWLNDEEKEELCIVENIVLIGKEFSKKNYGAGLTF